ncbi:rab effector MyRIP-like [Solea solea]|uniref:rab effector MyRIP-like n=1 Tax=Solea solea TaxID=90069 RepID=UPI00272BA5A8|nr:rab effector MyRIP-like [Solea solea]
MGRKLDLSVLTDNEAEHVLQVVQRDMKLRKKEEKRLSELKQELDEEGSRCLLLSRQRCFNRRCCIRCCLPFTFLFNPKRQCQLCRYNVCKACRVYDKQDKAWLCSSCQKSRLLKTQSLEWFYTNVKQRFKRFGSAKVLKTLYRKHLAEHSDLTEGSGYEESVCNEGSVCGSDSTFYRQSEEHSMAETLTVALRVAEEAIDEAISKAELDTDSQEKQKEALYLQEHRGELIEELAQTIVQKIISSRKTLADTREKNNQDWPLEQNADPHHRHHPATCDQACSSLKHQPALWRSHSASSLVDDDSPALIRDSLQLLKKEGSESTMAAWKSVDRLDNTVLQSADRNWIALQSIQLSRPGLLTKRKSLVYSALEKESGIVSAYEGLGSDSETKPQSDISQGAALGEIHKKMTDSNFNPQGTQDRSPTPRTDFTDLPSDSDGKWKSHKPLHAFYKRNDVPVEVRRTSASRGTSIIDMNFNSAVTSEEESSVAAEVGKVGRSRKKRRSKKEQAATFSVTELNKNDWSQPSPDTVTSDTFETSAPEQFDPKSDLTDTELTYKSRELSGRVCDSTGKEECDKETGSSDDGQRQGTEETDGEDERFWKTEMELDDGRMLDDLEIDEEMKCRLYKVVEHSRLTYLSSTDDELDRVNQSEGELDEDNNEQEGLTFKLWQLEKELKASQCSSTEDELDRVGVEEKKTEEEAGDGSNEELAVKVCKLANQVNATQFSSTEDELDRVGRDGENEIEEEILWKLQAQKAVQAAHLRDLSSLVGTSQFSSTEDELDEAEKTEGERDLRVNEGGNESSCDMEDVWDTAKEQTESFTGLDVKMFDLEDETCEKVTSENVPDNQMDTNNVQQVKTEDPQKRRCFEETSAKVTEDEMIEECMCGDAKETKSMAGAEDTEIISSNETRTEQGDWAEGNEEEKFQESSDDQRKWEAIANSDEEDAEFDRIISSMLTMTLEDMQVETLQSTDEESGRTNLELENADGRVKISGFNDKVIVARSINASKETGSEKELQRRCDDVRPESAGKEKVTGDETFRKKERGARMSRNTNEQQGKEKEHKERRNVAQQMSTEEEEYKDQRDGSGGAAAEEESERKESDEKDVADTEQRSKSSLHKGFLSPEEIQHRYSAVSLCSITTEVLKVLNATEELLQGVEGGHDNRLSAIDALPPNTDVKKLDEQFCRLEENVYVAAGAVYGLEAELSDLEECARRTCTSTPDMELSFLEEQVASAAARVQHSELQICDISARIAALRSAGLIVDTQSHLTKTRTTPVLPVTLVSTRQVRRRLPAPPAKEDKES